MKVKAFNREIFKSIRPSLNEALTKVAKEYGINLEFNTISFDDNRFTTRLTGEIPGKSDTLPVRFASINVGFPAVGTRFKTGRSVFEVTGYKTNRPKYPICATQVGTGRKFKFTVAQVNNLIKN